MSLAFRKRFYFLLLLVVWPAHVAKANLVVLKHGDAKGRSDLKSIFSALNQYDWPQLNAYFPTLSSAKREEVLSYLEAAKQEEHGFPLARLMNHWLTEHSFFSYQVVDVPTTLFEVSVIMTTLNTVTTMVEEMTAQPDIPAHDRFRLPLGKDRVDGSQLFRLLESWTKDEAATSDGFDTVFRAKFAKRYNEAPEIEQLYWRSCEYFQTIMLPGILGGDLGLSEAEPAVLQKRLASALSDPKRTKDLISKYIGAQGLYQRGKVRLMTALKRLPQYPELAERLKRGFANDSNLPHGYSPGWDVLQFLKRVLREHIGTADESYIEQLAVLTQNLSSLDGDVERYLKASALPYLVASIEQQSASARQGTFILWRGSRGVTAGEVTAWDFPYPLGSAANAGDGVQTDMISLSYSNSLLEGTFFDSRRRYNTGARSCDYYEADAQPFYLRLNIADFLSHDLAEQNFYISPLSVTVSLFGAGGFFHSRSKISVEAKRVGGLPPMCLDDAAMPKHPMLTRRLGARELACAIAGDIHAGMTPMFPASMLIADGYGTYNSFGLSNHDRERHDRFEKLRAGQRQLALDQAP